MAGFFRGWIISLRCQLAAFMDLDNKWFFQKVLLVWFYRDNWIEFGFGFGMDFQDLEQSIFQRIG